MVSSRVFLDNQTGLMKKGTQQFTFGTNLIERRVNGNRQFLGVFGREVSEFDEFTIRPDRFDRVEFRRVRRQPLHRDAGDMFGEELADDFSLMNSTVIHDEYLPAWYASSDTTQESQDFFRGDVMRVDGKEEIKPFTLWRDGNSADNRESVVSLPVLKDRSLSFEGPSLSDDGLKHKTRFVNENDRLFFPSRPVSLSSASFPCAIVLSALRSALLLCAGAFDSSNPKNAESSIHGKGDTLSQISSRLPRLFAAASITGSDTQKPLVLLVVLSEAGLFVPGSYESLFQNPTKINITVLTSHQALLIFAFLKSLRYNIMYETSRKPQTVGNTKTPSDEALKARAEYGRGSPSIRSNALFSSALERETPEGGRQRLKSPIPSTSPIS